MSSADAKANMFRVERSIDVNAAPERIFALISDFRRWVSWSPYEVMDPALKRTYGGAPSGTGAVYSWEGNNKVGVGRMEITNATPSSAIIIKLDFFKPFQARNVAEFTLEGKGDSTIVTWAMHGPNVCSKPWLAKIIGLVFSMDRIVGKQFESGLANLKTVAEAGSSE